MAHSHYELNEQRYASKGHGIRIPYVDYELTGKTILIRKKVPVDEEYNKFGGSIYPWANREQRVCVMQETPYFITIGIPVHRSPGGFDDSAPYLTSIHKNDIANGEFILKTLDGERIEQKGRYHGD